jgi:hypothetical protein
VHHAIELPLYIDFLFAPEAKSVQAQGTTEVAEYRFDYPHALTVVISPLGGVDLVFHILYIGPRRIF